MMPLAKRLQDASRVLAPEEKIRRFQRVLEAAGLGLEPRLPDPESGVLPLDDPAMARPLYRRGRRSQSSRR
jgi:hypothetical protein